MDDLTTFRLRNVLSCILEGVVRRADEVGPFPTALWLELSTTACDQVYCPFGTQYLHSRLYGEVGNISGFLT